MIFFAVARALLARACTLRGIHHDIQHKALDSSTAIKVRVRLQISIELFLLLLVVRKFLFTQNNTEGRYSLLGKAKEVAVDSQLMPDWSRGSYRVWD